MNTALKIVSSAPSYSGVSSDILQVFSGKKRVREDIQVVSSMPEVELQRTKEY